MMVVVFIDLDNTLILRKKGVPGLPTTGDEIRRMHAVLRQYGVPNDVVHQLRGHQRLALFWNGVMAFLHRSDFPTSHVSAIRAELHHILLKHEQQDHAHCYLPDETIPFLTELTTTGWPLVMLTNTSRSELDQLFTRFKLTPFFRDAITRDDVKKMKPDPEGLLTILTRYAETDFVIVDDLDYGVLVAQAARATGYHGHAILVDRGRYHETDFQVLQPDFVVTSLTEILPIIYALYPTL